MRVKTLGRSLPGLALVSVWAAWVAPAAVASEDATPFSLPAVVFDAGVTDDSAGHRSMDAKPPTDADIPDALGTLHVSFGATDTLPISGPAPLGVGGPPPRLALDAVDAAAAAQAEAAQPPRRRPVAFVYSDGYATRAKIHRYASFATLPLFGAQGVLGQRLDEGTTSEPVRAAHAAIATTMVGLFGVNTVTGVWNLWEGRKDPANRTRRVLHSILMLGSDAGFVATGLLAPTNEGGGNRSLHRSVAFTSIGIASAGYLLMLLGH